MRTHYRTSANSGVSFGCLGSTIVGFVIIGLVALAAALVLPVLAVVAAAFVGWVVLWVVPTELWRAFAAEWGTTGGVASLALWVGFLVGLVTVVSWVW